MINENDIFARQPQVNELIETGESRCAAAGRYEPDIGKRLIDEFQAVPNGGRHNDGRAVLIIMKHRDLQALIQFTLDDETVRRTNVLKIDGTERGFKGRHCFDKSLRVGLIHLYIEGIDVRKLLEQHRLAFHHGLGRQRPDVAQPKDRGAVGHDTDQVAARGKRCRRQRIVLYPLTGKGDARRVRLRQVDLVGQRLGRHDRQLSGRLGTVIGQRALFQRIRH